MKALTKNIFFFIAGFIFCLVFVSIVFMIFLPLKQKRIKEDFNNLGNFDDLMKQAKKIANDLQQKKVDISDEKINSILRKFPPTVEFENPNKKEQNKKKSKEL